MFVSVSSITLNLMLQPPFDACIKSCVHHPDAFLTENNLVYTLISLIAVHYLIKEETIPSVAVRISRRLKSDKKIVVSDGPSWRPLVSLLFLVLLVPEKTSTSFFRGQCF